MTYLLFVLGLGFLVAGGDVLIRGALGVANRFGLSPLLAGLVIVGFGTSAPELVVSVNAALSGSPDIAIGNIVGSNIANILLILGICALIYPISVQPAIVKRDGIVMLGATAALVSLSFTGLLIYWHGILFLCALLAYLVYTYKTEKRNVTLPSAELHRHEAEEVTNLPKRIWVSVVFVAIGLVALIGGAHLLVTSAVEIATEFGISETIIGLTLVAVGTSLPELSVSVIAAFRRHTDVALGNILGSNIFNILGILGISSLITDLPINERIVNVDQWVMTGSALLLIAFIISGWRLTRIEGGIFLSIYVGYTFILLQ